MDRSLEIVDLWQTAPPPVGAGVSFAAGATSEVPLWRLDLGHDLDAARPRLIGLEDQTRRTQGQLEGITDRLDRHLRRAAPDPGGAVSFAVATADRVALPDPERDLLSSAGQSEVSFAAAPSPDLSAARDELDKALRRLYGMLIHMAWVETLARGRLVGRTTVGWTGKTQTAVVTGMTLKTRDLHQRNVSLAVASRMALLRTVVTVQGIAARLSLLSATGGLSAIAALPMAWNYVKRVLNES